MAVKRIGCVDHESLPAGELTPVEAMCSGPARQDHTTPWEGMSKEVADRLKLARTKVGETQREFALRMGVPQRTLISWENDQRTPRGLALEALTSRLDQIFVGR